MATIENSNRIASKSFLEKNRIRASTNFVTTSQDARNESDELYDQFRCFCHTYDDLYKQFKKADALETRLYADYLLFEIVGSVSVRESARDVTNDSGDSLDILGGALGQYRASRALTETELSRYRALRDSSLERVRRYPKAARTDINNED